MIIHILNITRKWLILLNVKGISVERSNLKVKQKNIIMKRNNLKLELIESEEEEEDIVECEKNTTYLFLDFFLPFLDLFDIFFALVFLTFLFFLVFLIFLFVFL